MQEIKVKYVLISKQYESTANFEKLINIAKEKNIQIVIIKKGDRIEIEKDIVFDTIWPNGLKQISENAINNNSIVCKLNYKSFSMLFSGDIEEIAEREILKEYKNNLQILKSTVLKVAHHGSNTSSIREFVNAVSPSIALIGVGKNNLFGHPNDEVIDRLKNLRYESI